jgi:hypothetical protein
MKIRQEKFSFDLKVKTIREISIFYKKIYVNLKLEKVQI